MDFVCGLPRSKNGHEAVWVVVNQLTKNAHFLAMNMTDPMEKPRKLYLQEIVRLHRVPKSIVSDQDPRFTSGFWKELQKALGTQLCPSTSNHSRTDGRSERIIQILEDMLGACVMDFGES